MVAVVNRANTEVIDLGAGRYRITKTSGGDGYNASATSSVAIDGDFVLWARSLSPDTSVLVAVTANPDESDGYDTLDYAAHLIGAVTVFYERATYIPPVIANDGRVWIGRTGTVLTFRTGPRFASATVQRTVSDISGPLYFDSAIHTDGGAIEVRFDAPGGWTEGHRPRSGTMLGIGFHTGGLGR